MLNKKNNHWRVIAFISLLLLNYNTAYSEYLDSIVAIVEDDVILNSELHRESASIKQRMVAANAQLPPDNILHRQVLEKLIVDKLQRLLAIRSGIKITEDNLNAAIGDIAQRNNMNIAQFKQELNSQGMGYQDFEDNVRHEIIINQLRGREISQRVSVSDREVEHYLETQGGFVDKNARYHLGHILISVPEAASASEIQQAQQQADQLAEKLRQGLNFKQAAMKSSSGGAALQGGDMGWRTLSQMPSLFVDSAKIMVVGDISKPIRSPRGFHIIKLLALDGQARPTPSRSAKQMITETQTRHILIKINELVDDKEAQRRLLSLKSRIRDGASFEALARANSDDKGSAIKGGELGWVTPGALVAPFEETMNKLAINELSEPVQTQFGWHLIQVLDRKEKDNSEQFKKEQIREEIRHRKIEEETELWLRRLRDEAYVEIREDML